MVGLALARHRVGQRLEALGQFVQQEKLLVALARRGDNCHRAFFGLGQAVGNLTHRAWPSGVALRPAHLGQTIVTADPLVVEPACVAHPIAVDRIVPTRLVAVHPVFARADDRVAAGAAAGAKALGFLQEPDAHLEPEIVRCQRAHRAEIHCVERVVVVKRLAGIGRDLVVAASVHDAQRIVAGDVGGEPDAAGAQHAPLGVERDARAKVDGLRLVHLHLGELALRLSVLDRVFLKFAFAGLVADRAVKRVVDQQRLKHRLAHLPRFRAAGVYLHPGNDAGRAADDAARRSRLIRKLDRENFWSAVVVRRWFAVRAGPSGHGDMHEAHSAVAGHRQLGMIAVMGNLDAGMLAGLQDRGRLRLALPVRRGARHLHCAAIHFHRDGVNCRFCPIGCHRYFVVASPLRLAKRASSSAPRFSKSSRNLSTKLITGQAHASPKAQMVRPCMFCAICRR